MLKSGASVTVDRAVDDGRFGPAMSRAARSSWPVCVLVVCTLSGIGSAAGGAHAAAAGAEINLRIVNQPLADVATTLSSLSGVPVTVYGTLKGSVENWTAKGSALAVFEELGRRTRTFMAYDGIRIIMASAEDLTTTVIDLGGRNEATALKTVGEFFPIYPAESVHYDRQIKALVVRGPTQFAEPIGKAFARISPSITHIVRYGVGQDVSSDSE